LTLSARFTQKNRHIPHRPITHALALLPEVQAILAQKQAAAIRRVAEAMLGAVGDFALSPEAVRGFVVAASKGVEEPVKSLIVTFLHRQSLILGQLVP
jgi:hypothetical protein